MAKIRYSIVAPCYNEEGNLPELYRRIAEVMDESNEPWELVLINDGSIDRTSELMQELHQTDPRVHYLDFARQITGHPIPAEVVARRPGDPADLIAGSDTIRRELGWTPQYPDVRQIIDSAWKWHQSHPNGYED